MTQIRIIARLDVKAPSLIKGVQLEGVRVIGDPEEFAHKYYLKGIDEIIYMDAVASLYGRNNLADLVARTTRNVFVPVTVGGGIRNLDDVERMLRAGADKVAINTAVIKNPSLITDVAKRYGSQCMVVSIEAKRNQTGGWQAYIDNGREPTGKDVVSWVQDACERGAGEILLTSVDQEGTKKGFDLSLASAVADKIDVPLIMSGGMGSLEHISDLLGHANVDAVALASVLHYQLFSLDEINKYCLQSKIDVRSIRAVN